MTRRAKWLRRSAVMLLVPAFAASIPSIQFCILTADGTARARFIRCLEPGMLTPAEPVAPVAVAAPSGAPSCRSEAANACRVGGECPFAANGDADCAATASATCDVGAARPVTPTNPRQALRYCLGDPVAGRALRTHSPLIATPGPLVAWLAFAATVSPDDAPAQTTWPGLAALAPSRLATARPPVRAPPART